MKRTEKEFGHKVRILKVLNALLDQPNHYTKRKLAERHNVTPKTIGNDFQALATAGFLGTTR
ncbi:MAG: hypothetical protein IPJ74_25850 [Saprospiraceae bacterium]|nr:hypothetical protein [Saprospiraceae bacterium]